MPYKRRYSRRGRRRRYGRRRRISGKRKMKRRNRMKYQIVRNVMAPDSVYVKLKYNQHIDFTTGTTGNQAFRGNSVFDPDQTGAGDQPSGFDQYAAMFGHYEVYASACKCRVVNISPMALEVTLIPLLNTTNPGINAILENPYGKSVMVGPLTGTPIKTFSNFMRTKKLFGRATESVNFSAAVTTNPSKQWFWYFNVKNIDNVTTLDLQLDVILTYYVKFFERKILIDAV